VSSQVVSIAKLPSFELAEGITAQALFGEGVMLTVVELAPDSEVPKHEHPHEQLGVVLKGELRLEVSGTEHVLGELDAYALAGGVEHSARAGRTGATVLDVFHPVREDYRAAASGR
jgi:quercetin dioxygenase-like cupin family protein